jgi:hypothetical protein
MAKRSTAQRGGKPAEPAATVEPEVTEDTEAPEAPGAAAAEATEEEPEFLNRAARRAKGKGNSQPLVRAQQSQFARRGNVTNRRDYGHRRSG